MKRVYHTPEITDFGRVEQITLGQLGSEPDFRFTGGQLVNVNNTCNAGGTATACLVPNS